LTSRRADNTEAPASPNTVIGFGRYLLKQRFGRDVTWNLGSVVILGVASLGINVLIGHYTDAEGVGVFGQVFVVYMLLAQLAAGGIHASVLKHTAQYADDATARGASLLAGVALAALLSVPVVLVGWLTMDLVGAVFGSPEVGRGLRYALPGCGFFAVNKVLLAYLNGRRFMRAYAVFQGSRYILILACVWGLAASRARSLYLPGALTIGELALLIGLLSFIAVIDRPKASAQVTDWLPRHFVFGVKALLGGVLIEVNTKIDIMTLGVLASDRVVGVYVLASYGFQALMQVAAVLRTNFNPLLTRMYYSQQPRDVAGAVRSGIRLSYAALAVLIAISVGGFYVLAKHVMPGAEFSASLPLFGVLVGGMIVVAGYLPFRMILVQTGYPGYQALFWGVSTISSLALCILLIPRLGAYGAATATSLSLILSVLYLRVLGRRVLRMRF
jgi:O-antigen/teichoic acid export membrane protein